MRTLPPLLVCAALVLAPDALLAQSMKKPDRSLVRQAMSIVNDSVFARLESGEADALAEWVVDQTHSEVSGTSRIQQVNEFQSQFRMILQGGPDSPFGALDGYDLLQESALPGTDRYFRLTYMTYHQRTPLVWEFHFYVQPDGNLSMPYFQFNGQNPFTYLSTPDMLINRYFEDY